MADGGAPLPTLRLVTAGPRRRPVVVATRMPAQVAAEAMRADAELDAMLSRPIPRDEGARLMLVARLGSALGRLALDAYETDACQVDVRGDYAAQIDGIVARLGEIRAAGGAR